MPIAKRPIDSHSSDNEATYLTPEERVDGGLDEDLVGRLGHLPAVDDQRPRVGEPAIGCSVEGLEERELDCLWRRRRRRHGCEYEVL